MSLFWILPRQACPGVRCVWRGRGASGASPTLAQASCRPGPPSARPQAGWRSGCGPWPGSEGEGWAQRGHCGLVPPAWLTAASSPASLLPLGTNMPFSPQGLESAVQNTNQIASPLCLKPSETPITFRIQPQCPAGPGCSPRAVSQTGRAETGRPSSCRIPVPPGSGDLVDGRKHSRVNDRIARSIARSS